MSLACQLGWIRVWWLTVGRHRSLTQNKMFWTQQWLTSPLLTNKLLLYTGHVVFIYSPSLYVTAYQPSSPYRLQRKPLTRYIRSPLCCHTPALPACRRISVAGTLNAMVMTATAAGLSRLVVSSHIILHWWRETIQQSPIMTYYYVGHDCGSVPVIIRTSLGPTRTMQLNVYMASRKAKWTERVSEWNA